MMQYLRCTGNTTWLAYAIVRSFPSCHCVGSAPIIEFGASVSKRTRRCEFGTQDIMLMTRLSKSNQMLFDDLGSTEIA